MSPPNSPRGSKRPYSEVEAEVQMPATPVAPTDSPVSHLPRRQRRQARVLADSEDDELPENIPSRSLATPPPSSASHPTTVSSTLDDPFSSIEFNHGDDGHHDERQSDDDVPSGDDGWGIGGEADSDVDGDDHDTTESAEESATTGYDYSEPDFGLGGPALGDSPPPEIDLGLGDDVDSVSDAESVASPYGESESESESEPADDLYSVIGEPESEPADDFRSVISEPESEPADDSRSVITAAAKDDTHRVIKTTNIHHTTPASPRNLAAFDEQRSTEPPPVAAHLPPVLPPRVNESLVRASSPPRGSEEQLFERLLAFEERLARLQRFERYQEERRQS